MSEPVKKASVSEYWERAKLFWSGRSQAVRLAKKYRFAGNEVRISRRGSSVVIEPLEMNEWRSGYWQNMPSFADEDDWARPADEVPASIEDERDIE